MSTTLTESNIQTLEILKDEEIRASMDIVFETILEEMGPLNQRPDGTPLQMVIEPRPGGRWYRDLGDNSGHLWGHVQSIKSPSLLEIRGPLFMSAPVMSHILYRLEQEGPITRVRFSHRALGQIDPVFLDGRVNTGWGSLLDRIRKSSESKTKKKVSAARGASPMS